MKTFKSNFNSKTVRKGITLTITLFFMITMLVSCIKPQYATAKGKRKNKQYNSIQYAKPAGRVNNARNTGKH